MSTVLGIHLVARNPRNNRLNPDGSYSCRAWRIAEKHLRTARYVALHQRKDQLSYLQGTLVGAHPDDLRPDRWVLVVVPDQRPRRWEGGGRGEKGYLRTENRECGGAAQHLPGPEPEES